MVIRSVLILACALICLSCDSDVPTTPPDGTDSISHLRRISLDIGNVHYDFDSLNAGSYTYIADWGPGLAYSDSMTLRLMRSSSILQPGDISFQLYLRWQKPHSGSYQWDDLTVKKDGFGCIIIIDSMNSDYRRVYTSISGTTHAKVFSTTYTNSFYNVDSVFGTFSGTVKDSLGNVVEIRNGTFYWGDLK